MLIKLTGKWLAVCPSHVQQVPAVEIIDPFDLHADFRRVIFGDDFPRDLRPVEHRKPKTEEQLHIEVREEEIGICHQFQLFAVHPELDAKMLGEFMVTKSNLQFSIGDPIRVATMQVLLHLMRG